MRPSPRQISSAPGSGGSTPPAAGPQPAVYGQALFDLGIPGVVSVGAFFWTLGIMPENFAAAGFTSPATLRGVAPLAFGGGQSIRAASGPEAGDVLNLGTAIPGITAAFSGPAGPLNECAVDVSYDGNLGIVSGSIQGRWKGIALIIFVDVNAA